MGDLMYEICYFPHELKFNNLSNTMYFEDKYAKTVSIKEKKILFTIREGGFRGFGYEIKNNLINLSINEYKNYRCPEPFIYNMYSFQKQTDLARFFKIISSSHHTQDIIRAGKYLQKRNNYAQFLDSSTPIIAFFLIK